VVLGRIVRYIAPPGLKNFQRDDTGYDVFRRRACFAA